MRNDFKDNDIIQEAGAIVTNEQNKFLALVSTNDVWSLPKGHIEPGETPCDTAVRETLEETGILAKANSLIRRFIFSHHGYDYDLVVYHASYIDGKERYDEHPDTFATWLSFEEAKQLKAADVNYSIIMKLVEEKIKSDHAPEKILLLPSDIEQLSNRLNMTIDLERMSNSHSKRPLYRIVGTNLTARLLESKSKAIQVERALSYLNSLKKPVVERVGQWIVTSFIDGKQLSRNSISDVEISEAGYLLGSIHKSSVSISVDKSARYEAISYVKEKYEEAITSLTKANFLDENETQTVSCKMHHWLTNELPTKKVSFVHWDFVPENIIMTEQGLSVIDFESCRLFFPDYDVIKAIYNFSPDLKKSDLFLQGYFKALGVADKKVSKSMEMFYLIRTLANRLDKPMLDYRFLYERLLLEIRNNG